MKGGFLIIALIIIVIFLLSSYIYVKYRLDDIRANWKTEQCKPYILPFSWLIKDYEEGAIEGATRHMNYCMSKGMNSSMSIFFAPIRVIMNIIPNTLRQFVERSSNMRKLFAKIEIMVSMFFMDLFKRIQEPILMLRKITLKISVLIKKMAGLSQILIYMLSTIAFTTISTFKFIGGIIKTFIMVLIGIGWLALLFCCGPVVAVLGTWAAGVGYSWTCFDKNTEITMADGSQVKIPLVKNGNEVKHGGKVTGIFKFHASKHNMYNYKNIIVSGCHTVFDGSKWKHIKDCDRAEKIENYTGEFIYCLATENNKLFINDTLFTDYYEVSDPRLVNKMRNEQLTKLNNLIISECGIDRKIKYPGRKTRYMYSDNYGFHYKTPIKMANNDYKCFYKLKIGDNTEFGTVSGIIKLLVDKDTVFYKNRFYPNLIVSGSQLIKTTEGIWQCVCECGDFFIYDKEDITYVYQLLTDKGTIRIAHYDFTDYNELEDKVSGLLDNIDTQLLTYLNNEKMLKVSI